MCLFFRVINLENQLGIPQDVPKGDKASKKPTWCEIFISRFLGSLLLSICKTWYGASNWSTPTTVAAAKVDHLAVYGLSVMVPFTEKGCFSLKPASLRAKSSEAHPSPPRPERLQPSLSSPARTWIAGQWKSRFSGHSSQDLSQCHLA